MSHAGADLLRHRLTVADYYRMAEVGILAPEARVELIDGEIIDMAPPGSPHAASRRDREVAAAYRAPTSAGRHAMVGQFFNKRWSNVTSGACSRAASSTNSVS